MVLYVFLLIRTSLEGTSLLLHMNYDRSFGAIFNVFIQHILLLGCFWHSYSFLLQYQPDEPITLWVNKVGPYNNPQETYNYYSLPFCRRPGNPGHKWGGLGEVLGGNELIDSQMDVKFQSMFFLYIFLYDYSSKHLSNICYL